MEELKERMLNSWFKRLVLIAECLLALAGAFAQSNTESPNTIQGTLGFTYGYMQDLASYSLQYQEQGKTDAWWDTTTLNDFHCSLNYKGKHFPPHTALELIPAYLANANLGQLGEPHQSELQGTAWTTRNRHLFYHHDSDDHQSAASSFSINRHLDHSFSSRVQTQDRPRFSGRLQVPL